jgi:FkbM family methyltransferase
MIFFIVRMYSILYGLVKDRFKRNLPGLGYALRKIKRDHLLSIHGRKMLLSHKVAVCYGRHISGEWNEPETHIFLNNLIQQMQCPIVFVDVGANIGEMVVDISRHNNVVQVIAFEPVADCVDAIKKSMDLNHVKNYSVITKLVGESRGQASFSVSRSVGGSSVLSQESTESASQIAITTLDYELGSIQESTIILIDVEGYEPQVLKGALQFIARCKPLIIFEYNHLSKIHFESADIRAILGSNYSIYRLTSDATLDNDIERAWNCVAIPSATVFSKILQRN